MVGRGDDGDGDDWKKGRLVVHNGFLFTKERWAVLAVLDWRENLATATIEFQVR